MKFWASTAFSPPEHYLPLARAVDEAGIHGIMMSDHIFYPRDLRTPYPYSPDGAPIWPPETAWPDNWVTISAMAAVTERVQFATSVYVAPARDLFTVAKQVGTAAVLSGNRVNLGVGAGWMREEFEQTGQVFDNRGRRLDDMIPALRELWRGGWVEYHGPHYDFGPLQIEPAPTRTVPIWCGGHSRAALRRAARLCDGWLGNAYPIEECEHYVGLLQGQREAAGRRDDPFEVILAVHAPPTPDVCERLSAAGVTGLICVPWLQGFPDDHAEIAGSQRGTELDRKIDATRRFAEQVVQPAAGI
ncbi:MAG TPA: TIGR03619 family F420-dependent LLM class oxidoreductase [Acidimicrobiia bacterium]|nr:TIGR03619 family F420-dependent LLM class oxidoreductase [Acidimicrobiia bacterium]